MDKKEFKKFCNTEFVKWGFKKLKKGYYLCGDKQVLGGLFLQSSNYSNCYYVNFCFFLGEYSNLDKYPSYYDMDVEGRMWVMSKTKQHQGECFMTTQIEYEEYSSDELRVFFDKEMEERILPPIIQGKKYILDNLNELYFLTLKPEEVMRKLQE